MPKGKWIPSIYTSKMTVVTNMPHSKTGGNIVIKKASSDEVKALIREDGLIWKRRYDI